ncbi:transferase [Fulvivirga ligni]|uniref:transferase n=1 Tax=Fulvivirga ligni TaxID=2904246 RepID=UPI001F45101F|nr:transferase [Fulvivirga ligni]UII19407.1 transferase [Fulvivirga ligni]
MYLLFPGRHHLMTSFQFRYLQNLIQSGLHQAQDVDGEVIDQRYKIDGVIFAVTSANHSGTKRNPIPFYLRAMMIQEFCKELEVPCYVYGIDDVGQLPNFATYTVKQVKHQSDLQLNLTPENTFVICSTPVLQMYQSLGFSILPAELKDVAKQEFSTDLPWDIVEQIVAADQWQDDAKLMDKVHPATQHIWHTYQLGEKVNNILSDPIIGEDGDITESRDYNTYVRQMDEIAEIKFKDTSPYILPGRIGDIGCAVGSWIKQASEDSRLRESDFYGIEVARQLFDICNQRKHNGEFSNPNVFFAQKNAVTSLVFEKEAMNTIHTSSLTHEIESYGSRKDLLTFIANRYDELVSGGVWINRDVIGPENGEQEVYMWLNKEDGKNDCYDQQFDDHQQLVAYLDGLSTYSRFLRFAQDFRKTEDDAIVYSLKELGDKSFVVMKLKDAAEFMLTKDYTDNWYSEMHERFCFWSITDWEEQLLKAGFQLVESSHAYTNPWIAENSLKEK